MCGSYSCNAHNPWLQVSGYVGLPDFLGEASCKRFLVLQYLGFIPNSQALHHMKPQMARSDGVRSGRLVGISSSFQAHGNGERLITVSDECWMTSTLPIVQLHSSGVGCGFQTSAAMKIVSESVPPALAAPLSWSTVRISKDVLRSDDVVCSVNMYNY